VYGTEREVGNGLRTSSLRGAASFGVSDLNQPVHCCGFRTWVLSLTSTQAVELNRNQVPNARRALGIPPAQHSAAPPHCPVRHWVTRGQGLISWPNQQPPVLSLTAAGGNLSSCGPSPTVGYQSFLTLLSSCTKPEE